MKPGPELQKLLRKKYEPSGMINMRFKGNDVTFKTDTEGNPVLLFIGKRDETGNIKGDRFSRTLKRDESGAIIKDHWDLKGKAT